MKKIDGFFVTILFIFVLLAGVYFYAYSTLSYFETNPALKAELERKKGLISLESKLKKIAHEKQKLENQASTNSRNIASIPAEVRNTEFVVDEDIVGDAELAKKYYIKAKTKCYESNSELDCLRTIEEAVTHFPESSWTAESLVLLTDYYYRTRRISQAREILRILKLDFKDNISVQKKVIVIERQLI